MEYRQLGRSGLRVSTIALGTMTFGGRDGFSPVGSSDVDEARRIVDIALDAGVNLVDTADVYSSGSSEEIVGEVLQGRRDRVVLATKARMRMGDGANDEGLSRGYLLRACEASLRRLGTEYIDLYQVHERDGSVPPEETLDALDTLVHQGKVRYIGCSNYSAWHIMESLGTSERLGMVPFSSQQIYYSLLHREAEYELVPLSVDRGLGVLVWSPLAGGLLTGKYRRDDPLPEGSRRALGWGEPPIYDEGRMWETIETLVSVAEGRGSSPAQVALAWLLGRPAVASVIVGARREEQLHDTLGAAELKLSPEETARLEEVSRPPLIYPYWHQLEMGPGRVSRGDESLLGQYRRSEG